MKLHACGDGGGDGGVIGVNHGIGEATDTGDDGDAAVAQTIQLGEPARLKSGGNKYGVTTALHEVGGGFVVANMNRDVGRVFGHGGVQCGFEGFIACAKDDEASILRDDGIDGVGDNVNAFLPSEAADDAEQWRVAVRDVEVVFDGAFVGGAFVQCLACEGTRKGVITGGIPHVHVDAVDDATDRVAARAQ